MCHVITQAGRKEVDKNGGGKESRQILLFSFSRIAVLLLLFYSFTYSTEVLPAEENRTVPYVELPIHFFLYPPGILYQQQSLPSISSVPSSVASH